MSNRPLMVGISLAQQCDDEACINENVFGHNP